MRVVVRGRTTIVPSPRRLMRGHVAIGRAVTGMRCDGAGQPMRGTCAEHGWFDPEKDEPGRAQYAN